MTTKNDIEKAIGARIGRFNNLWQKALGYTFEEEPGIMERRYEEAMNEWNENVAPVLQARCRELGYENDDEYLGALLDDDTRARDPLVQSCWDKCPTRPSPLYSYEMSVVDEARRIACWFIDTFPGHEEEKWKEIGEGLGAFQFVDRIRELGYDGWNEGHSGNSGTMAVSFAYTLLFQTEMFPYMHGALCYLVGDKGYHDDRSDVQAAVDAYRKSHPEG